MHASPVGASNVLKTANGAVRLANVYKLRRYRSSPVLTVHASGPYVPSVVMLGSCGENPLAPYILLDRTPASRSAASRRISASTRKRGPRASSTFSGSRAASSALTADDCRY